MKNHSTVSSQVPYEKLTERETEILALIADGSSNREIAEALFIAHSTVRWYIRQIYNKMGVETRDQAIKLAVKMGLKPSKIETTSVIEHILPAQTNAFIGREHELGELTELITDPNLRLITILAPGGMGKTRLVLELAERINSPPLHITDEQSGSVKLLDGVIFVPLAALPASDLIIPTIAARSGYQFQQDGREPKQQLLDYFRNKRMLLILDNIEHLLDGAGIVSEILENAIGIQIVVTSRERLNLNAETVYTIAGMEFPDWSPDDVLECDTMKLFLQSAKRAKSGFILEINDINYLASICKLVDGMPLAIELAAAWVEMLSLDEIANEITQNLDFLSTNMRDIPQRQHSIRAVFEYSWKRLSVAEQNVLMKLAVFQGGCTREATEVVAGADLFLLQALINKSLMHHNSDGRYEMHGLLRQYAEERLQAIGEAIDARTIHSEYYADLLHQLKHQLRGKRQSETLSIIGQDIENIRVGWYQAVEHQMIDVIEQYLDSLYYFYDIRSRMNEGLEIFSLAIKPLAQNKPTGKRLMLLGKVLARQGSLAHRLGNYRQATQLLDASLKILKRIDMREEVAFVLNNLADVARAAGQYQDATQLCKESLTIFQELGDEWSIAGTLNNLGVSAHISEAVLEAEQYYRESLGISIRLDDQHGVAISFINLGALAHDLENYEEAQQHYKESLALSKQLGDQYGIAASLINLGRTAFMLDAYAEGKQYCEESLKLYRQLGNVWGIAASLINLGDILCNLGDLQEARRNFHEALTTALEIHARPLVVEIVVGMADILAREGKSEVALSLLIPTTQHPMIDLEIRKRADSLCSNLISELPKKIVASLRESRQSESLEAVAKQIFGL
jgi:predicted ATPase/DNA-binding CsgD family transcriptional regulator